MPSPHITPPKFLICDPSPADLAEDPDLEEVDFILHTHLPRFLAAAQLDEDSRMTFIDPIAWYDDPATALPPTSRSEDHATAMARLMREMGDWYRQCRFDEETLCDLGDN